MEISNGEYPNSELADLLEGCLGIAMLPMSVSVVVLAVLYAVLRSTKREKIRPGR